MKSVRPADVAGSAAENTVIAIRIRGQPIAPSLRCPESQIMQTIEPSTTTVAPRRSVSRHGRSAGRGDTVRLGFYGALTLATCQRFEKKVIGALKRQQQLELDLSGIDQIDLYGIHLIDLLQRTAPRQIIVVASSSTVEEARQHLFTYPSTPAAEA